MVVHAPLVRTVLQLAILASLFLLLLFFVLDDGGPTKKAHSREQRPLPKSRKPAADRKCDLSRRRNVLFIMSDDLRPQLNCYRGRHFPNPTSKIRMYTPNIDRLASGSILFTRAYVQLAICGPSRASMMTSRRPDTIHNWLLNNNFRLDGRNVTSLPQYFMQKGYHSEGIGKIFHRGTNWENNDPVSWSVPWRALDNEGAINSRYGNWSWSAATEEERREYPLPDEIILQQGIESLRRLAPKALSGEMNFFLGVGFLKPHLPFVFPDHFLHLYPLGPDLDIPNVSNRYFPLNYSREVYMQHTELVVYPDVLNRGYMEFNEQLPDRQVRELRRAYFATVSFVDQLIGILVSELEALGLADDTIVCFLGDHGWHLGENGIWGKYTNFEQATHTPLMIRVPGCTDAGIRSDAVVEFVDLFPTVAELAGVGPPPPCPPGRVTAARRLTDVCTEGVSLAPLVRDPDAVPNRPAMSQIFSFTPPRMAYSLRTDRYRYTEWVPLAKETIRKTNESASRRKAGGTITNYRLLFDEVQHRELYDMDADPEENVNLAGNTEYADVIDKYSQEIRQRVYPVYHDVKATFF